MDEASSIRPVVIGGGLQHLRLAARAGVGLENFYGRLGWKEIGRWPGAAGPGDDRDEILMALTL